MHSLFLEATPTKTAWNRIGQTHHHGINIPLFSLRSEKGCGIGEFLDLIPLIAWCKEVGFDVIQLLPLNDTGRESSPYNALSSLALDPIYLSLWKLPYLHKHKRLEKRILSLQKLNSYPFIPYPLVFASKMDFLKDYYLACFSEFREDPQYLGFVKKHSWLPKYALFKAYKEKSFHSPWESWPHILTPSSVRVEDLEFYTFLQFLSFEQFYEVKKVAAKHQIFLKGDIPILISPESTDVWLHQDEFDLSLEAGAPPDMFALEGQKWGFPIYNWDVIAKNDYQWWKRRLAVSSELYDIFRIDHIIGLFRIWALNRGEAAKDGRYIPSEEKEMILQGETILNALLTDLPMLPIGEDLGLGAALPEIRASLQKLGIPGTKIPRWEKQDDFFILGSEYPALSLTSLSTHDSETLTLWWDRFPIDAEAFALSRGIPYRKDLTSDIRFQLLEDSHKSASLFHINLLPEYLALFPDLIHPNPEDERINIPSTVNSKNWCYRMKPTIEELYRHHSLRTAMKSVR